MTTTPSASPGPPSARRRPRSSRRPATASSTACHRTSPRPCVSGSTGRRSRPPAPSTAAETDVRRRKRPPMPDDELKPLSDASRGLLYPSESDAPFDVFRWPGKIGATAKEAVVAQTKAGRTIEEVSIDDFFAGVEGSDDEERFKQLRGVVERTLMAPRVFRAGAGATKVDVYLIGKTRGGDWVGLHTTSVET